MKLRLYRLVYIWIVICLFANSLQGQEAELTEMPVDSDGGKLVYVIPVRSDIDASIVYVIRRGIKEAIENDADAVILHMDTYGGQVIKTEEITGILRRFEPQEETYTYIDTKAISAGAYISSATREIYMAPGSVIGAAVPVMMAPGGSAQEVDDGYNEKIKSALRGLVRANAELHGHNADVFDAMIDIDQGLSVDGNEIVPKGKVLTLTTNEAAKSYGSKNEPLLSSGTIDTLDELITKIGGDPATAVKIEPTGLEQLARLLVVISPFLLAGAFLCGYVEFKTPGFGVFGILAAVFALIFFFGHYVAGLSGHELLVVFFIGVILIAVELFILPGLILPGLVGAFLILGSLLFAMSDSIGPSAFSLPPLPSLEIPLMKLFASIVLSFLGALLLARILPKTSMYSQLILTGDNSVETPIEAAALEHTIEASMEGSALTVLRPSGTADFGDGPVDVVAEGTFIPKDARIKIVSVQKNRVVVQQIESS
ncbi:MAG: serine protease [Verrucomicrobiota bacterium]